MKKLTINETEKNTLIYMHDFKHAIKELPIETEQKKTLLNEAADVEVYKCWRVCNYKGYPVYLAPAIYWIDKRGKKHYIILPHEVKEELVPAGIPGFYTVPENKKFIDYWTNN